jgi:hypothetical protein
MVDTLGIAAHLPAKIAPENALKGQRYMRACGSIVVGEQCAMSRSRKADGPQAPFMIQC